MFLFAHICMAQLNRALPLMLNEVDQAIPVTQNTQKTFKAYLKTLLVKINFICTRIQNHFYINGFELSLALEERLGATRKLRIVMNEINILGKTM